MNVVYDKIGSYIVTAVIAVVVAGLIVALKTFSTGRWDWSVFVILTTVLFVVLEFAVWRIGEGIKRV